MIMRSFFNKVVIAVIFTAMAASCGQTRKEGDTVIFKLDTRQQNVQPFSESDYSLLYEIIPLETTEEADIKIFFNYIEVFKNYVYVSTMNESLRIFDADGNFINAIHKGERGGEVKSLRDFTINRNKERIEILDANKIHKYTLTGEFIETIEVGNFIAAEFGIAGETRVFLLPLNSVSNHNFTVIFGNKHRVPMEQKYGQTTTPVLYPKHFHNYNNELYFTGYSNRVYKLGANDSIPSIVAQFTNMYTNTNVKNLDMNQYETLCAQHNFFTYLNNFYVYNSELWGFSLYTGKLSTKFMYDSSADRIFYHPLNGIPYAQNNRWVQDGTEYYIFPPERFKDDIAQTIKDHDIELYNLMSSQPVAKKDNLWLIKVNFTQNEK